jgi:acetolactate synthase I/II/III large subunit
VAAKIAQPDRPVLALCGDGDFLMNGQELATAAQYGAGFVVLVVNNGKYGTIRMHQEREYPGRVYGTELKNPDFAAFSRAFGGHGELVERTEDFAAAYERAVRAADEKKCVSLIELKIDPDAITPATTLSAIREKSLKSKQ